MLQLHQQVMLDLCLAISDLTWLCWTWDLEDLLVLGRLTIYTLSTHTQQALLLSINQQANAGPLVK